jgi:hypothetical protein
LTKKLKKAGFSDLIQSSSIGDLDEDAIARNQLSKEQRDLMDFLAKFKKRLIKSVSKIEENKTDVAYQ